MAQRVPFIVTELGRDADPFMLHLFATLAEKERRLIAEHQGRVGRSEDVGRRLGNPTNLIDAGDLGRASARVAMSTLGGCFRCCVRSKPKALRVWPQSR